MTLLAVGASVSGSRDGLSSSHGKRVINNIGPV